MQKKAITYLRYSKDKQSNYSLERQAEVNKFFIDRFNITVLDTFIDDGHSARTLDRPDMNRLFAFIKKNYRNIDYLIVSELTRFSRKLGEAMQTVEEIQAKYNIKIVSAGRCQVYDVNDFGSFINMANEFTYGDAENRKRQSDINGGIYIAKAKEGRYIGAGCPYGYIKEGEAKKHLVIDPAAAEVVRFIFDSYAAGVQPKIIRQQAIAKGFNSKGQSILANLLSNPVYIAKQHVKPWKDLPGGLYPAEWLPIIDMVTWQQVQDRLRGKQRRGIAISEDFPLRGAVRCENGNLLSGAPSRGRHGKYYNYYKCKCPRHVNVRAEVADQQMVEIMGLLNVPADLIGNIYETTAQYITEETAGLKKQLMKLRTTHTDTQRRYEKVEEGFFTGLVPPDRYKHWQQHYTSKLNELQAEIDGIQAALSHTDLFTPANLQALTNLQAAYTGNSAHFKHDLINLVFDRKLYYKDGSYRTTYLLEILQCNALELRRKELLFIDKKTGLCEKSGEVELKVPLSNRIAKLIQLLQAG